MASRVQGDGAVEVAMALRVGIRGVTTIAIEECLQQHLPEEQRKASPVDEKPRALVSICEWSLPLLCFYHRRNKITSERLPKI